MKTLVLAMLAVVALVQPAFAQGNDPLLICESEAGDSLTISESDMAGMDFVLHYTSANGHQKYTETGYGRVDNNGVDIRVMDFPGNGMGFEFEATVAYGQLNAVNYGGRIFDCQ